MKFSLDTKDVLKLTAAGCAGCFTGAAFHINAVEHAARMTLDTANCRKQWAESFHRAKKVQSIFSMVGALSAAGAYYLDGDNEYRMLWLVGGGTLMTVMPWTIIAMLPDIKKSCKEDAIKTEGETWVRDHIVRWNKQHAVRTFIGCVAFDIFLYALLKS